MLQMCAMAILHGADAGKRRPPPPTSSRAAAAPAVSALQPHHQPQQVIPGSTGQRQPTAPLDAASLPQSNEPQV